MIMKFAPLSSLRKVRYVLPVAIATTLFSLPMVSPVLAQEQLTRMVTVMGRGVENIPTTISQVRLGVEVQGRTAEGVQQEAAQRTNAVVELLRSRNVDQLTTTGIYLSPQYNYENGSQELVGYTASNTVSFEIPTEQAGDILDASVSAGASRIDGISFTAEEEAIATAQNQALREATQEAQEQADVVLAALGLSRDEVVNIQINGAMPPMPPIPLARGAVEQLALSDAPTPVVGGEQQIEASVTLQISY
ncbi:MAG: SIMPL domain-containing protein [Leptolyngbyaceae cyanobacterium RM1_406_9]|nr:SIMPL domain-containing protein [Leptolyngbyaceae cyanobacterium RM1_406_9]